MTLRHLAAARRPPAPVSDGLPDSVPRKAGVPVRVDLGAILASETAKARFSEQLIGLSTSGFRFSLCVSGVGGSEGAADRLKAFCGLLRERFDEMAVPSASVGFAVATDALMPQSVLQIRHACLGGGRTSLIAQAQDFAADDGGPGAKVNRLFWEQLWQLRDVAQLELLISPLITPQCPLLSAEVGRAVLPQYSLQVPHGTAWVTAEIDLMRFCGPRGEIREDAMTQALHRCIDTADVVHDLSCWTTSALRHDAWLNRRLAVIVTGIGNLLKLRRDDPCRHETLRRLDARLGWIRNTLHAKSQRLAAEAGRLPAIDRDDPSRQLPPGNMRDDWKRRWQRAADASSVRHRNLLALSPWSIFPSGAAADLRYANLLPLLLHADTCAHRRAVSISHWNVNDYRGFYQRAWAVLQQR